MKFPSYFADADASFDDAEFIIFGVPYDRTSSYRKGAAEGPREIRQASWNFETYSLNTGVDLRDIAFHDSGDLEVGRLKPKEMVDTVRTFASQIVHSRKFPVALGGEHAITPGVVQAFPRDITVLSLDAHLDFREQYENESYSHACAIRRIADHITVANIAVVGVRSAEKEEFEEAQHQRLFSIDTFTIERNGLESCIAHTASFLKKKKIYLTLDIDVVDPAYAPGTSTPEPFGLTPLEVLKIMERFAPQLVGFDVVEVCPPYDQGQTALLAARLTRALIGTVWKHNHE